MPLRAATVDGITLHLGISGPDTAPPVMLVHSLGTDLRIWDAVVENLAGHFRLIRHDNRGHGLSSAPAGPYRMPELADDLRGLMDHLSIERAAICGISVGGQIAQDFASRFPERVERLVLCDTGHRIGDAELWNERIRAAGDQGLDAMTDAVLERWFTEDYRRERSAETALWGAMLARTPVEGYAGTCAAIRDADYTGAAGEITAPTLCVCGERDLATTPALMRELAGLMPHSRLEIVAGAAHLPCIERPEEFAALVRSFLEERHE